ncbi:hypothetical protein [Chitinophaga sp. Ak27]|uniref:hypothetical protein n=1 Tax=Chitinophaga sp. Ak27 TaxID=2726116 RepID=UPI00145DD6F6|nr:hypothetical protein [Chitinophaga sp. Ak27]NLU90492.1 hypothetical protein [Chitinophaga sp. Ak27]
MQINFWLPQKPALSAVGGTLILRHFWYPLVKGILSSPQDSSTWYAVVQIRSDRDTVLPVWINGADLSRSYASGTPPVGAWDERHSEVRVNGQLIAPLVWVHAGAKGDLETPLADEGYAYRRPVPVVFRKGVNQVIIQLPVGSFKVRDGQNPVKWMFTFIPLTIQVLTYE